MKPRDVSEPQDEAPAASTNVRAALGTGPDGSTGAGSTSLMVADTEAVEQVKAVLAPLLMDGNHSPDAVSEIARAVLSIPYVENLTRERDEALSDADNARSMARSRKQGKVLALIRAEKAEARVERLEAALTQCREALEIYADPFNRKDNDGSPMHVPDFYGELCFGDRASDVLDAIGAALSSSDAPHNE